MTFQADTTQIALAQEALFWAKVQGVSAVSVALLGLTGVVSILVTRWGLLTGHKRAQVEDAVSRCEEMRREIVPLIEQLAANLGANETKRFVADAGKISFPDEIDEAKAEKAIEWVRSLSPDGRMLSLRLLNQLETWSIHFTHGLADSNVAFKPCATIYCTVVVMLYASIITQRHNDPRSGPYQNVIDLFDRWYKKQRMEKIRDEVAKLQADGAFKAPPTK